MTSSEEYRANADACLKFARESSDAYAREALLELAAGPSELFPISRMNWSASVTR
jgi:hypothetical protein